MLRQVRSWILVLLSGLLICIAGCGDDNATSPQIEDNIINFPGDAATLQEALEMASMGDTVLVGSGTHMVDSTVVISDGMSGITLIGRRNDNGAMGTVRPVLDFSNHPGFVGIQVDTAAVGVSVLGLELRGGFETGVLWLGDDGLLRDCYVFAATRFGVASEGSVAAVRIEENLFINAGVFGIRCTGGASPEVIANTIVGSGDCGIFTSDAAPFCDRNLITHSANFGIACFGRFLPTLACNDIFDSATAHYGGGCVPGKNDLHEDPLFCDGIDYSISADSPCATENTAGCGRIGAVDVGCGR